jgi:hypothetical protein
LHNLKDNNLIDYEAYGTIELTKERWKFSKKNIRSLWYKLFIFKRSFKYRARAGKRRSGKDKKCNIW